MIPISGGPAQKPARPSRTFRRLLAGFGFAAGLLGGGAAVAPAAGAAGPEPAFERRPCQAGVFAGFRCGTVRVPVDHARPGGRSIRLAVVVRPADRPARSLGPLLLNTGGGGSAIAQLRLALETGGVRGALAERFDLVAVDPRGVGQSAPVRCGRPARGRGVTWFPRDRAAFERLVRDSRALAAACRRDAGTLLDFLDVGTHARDQDAVRRALGARRVTFYGIHQTTLVGRTYARLFGHRLRGLVLDTAIDDRLPPVHRLADEVRAVETALHRFAAWCATADECALRGQDVLARFDALVEQAGARPVPVRGGPPLTGEDIGRAAQEHLVFRIAWPGFAAALAEAAGGDGTALATSPDGTYDPLEDQVARCATTPPAARTYAGLRALQTMVRELAPRTGGSSRAWATTAGCIGWPGRPSSPDPGRVARRIPAALILQSTHQTLSSYENAFGLAEMLPGSRVLSRDGDDYSLVLFSPCAGAVFERYAATRRGPAPGLVCRD